MFFVDTTDFRSKVLSRTFHRGLLRSLTFECAFLKTNLHRLLREHLTLRDEGGFGMVYVVMSSFFLNFFFFVFGLFQRLLSSPPSSSASYSGVKAFHPSSPSSPLSVSPYLPRLRTRVSPLLSPSTLTTLCLLARHLPSSHHGRTLGPLSGSTRHPTDEDG